MRPDLLEGVLADGAEIPDDAERLRIPSTRCAACAARGVRCFHDPLPYEIPERNPEGYETR